MGYVEYLGDDDIKSYMEVVKSDPYNGTPVGKLECIGHYAEKSWSTFT